MKHNLRVTLVILAMFVITQFIGIYVVNHYFSNGLPLRIKTPEIQPTHNVHPHIFSLVMAYKTADFTTFIDCLLTRE